MFQGVSGVYTEEIHFGYTTNCIRNKQMTSLFPSLFLRSLSLLSFLRTPDFEP